MPTSKETEQCQHTLQVQQLPPIETADALRQHRKEAELSAGERRRVRFPIHLHVSTI